MRADHQPRARAAAPGEVAERVAAGLQAGASIQPRTRSIAAASDGEASGRVIRPGSSVKRASSSARSRTRRGGAHGISRTITRFVAPGVPVRRPAVSTTRAPGGSPAKSRAVTSAGSIMSSTVSAVGIVVG